jgi:hypothetical protein
MPAAAAIARTIAQACALHIGQVDRHLVSHFRPAIA